MQGEKPLLCSQCDFPYMQVYALFNELWPLQSVNIPKIKDKWVYSYNIKYFHVVVWLIDAVINSCLYVARYVTLRIISLKKCILNSDSKLRIDLLNINLYNYNIKLAKL